MLSSRKLQPSFSVIRVTFSAKVSHCLSEDKALKSARSKSRPLKRACSKIYRFSLDLAGLFIIDFLKTRD